MPVGAEERLTAVLAGQPVIPEVGDSAAGVRVIPDMLHRAILLALLAVPPTQLLAQPTLPRWGVGAVAAAGLSRTLQRTGGGGDAFLRLATWRRIALRAEAAAVWLPPSGVDVCLFALCDTRRVRFVGATGVSVTAHAAADPRVASLYAVAGASGYVTRWRGDLSDATGEWLPVPRAGPSGIGASAGVGVQIPLAPLGAARLRVEGRWHALAGLRGRPAHLLTLAAGPVF